jgi:hypothetical protein
VTCSCHVRRRSLEPPALEDDVRPSLGFHRFRPASVPEPCVVGQQQSGLSQVSPRRRSALGLQDGWQGGGCLGPGRVAPLIRVPLSTLQRAVSINAHSGPWNRESGSSCWTPTRGLLAPNGEMVPGLLFWREPSVDRYPIKRSWTGWPLRSMNAWSLMRRFEIRRPPAQAGARRGCRSDSCSVDMASRRFSTG